jgi:hypothetical protein
LGPGDLDRLSRKPASIEARQLLEAAMLTFRKTVLLCTSVLAMTLVLFGCATTQERATNASVPYDDDIDHQRMAAIDLIARQRGIDVIWVNPPRKKRTLASRE